MKIVGIHTVQKPNSPITTTLHLQGEFKAYYSDKEAGRNCVGNMVEVVYVGTYDCSNLKIGMEIEILYGKAIPTSKGCIQHVEKIIVLSK